MCSTPATRRCEPKFDLDGDDALGGVLGEVADALEVVGDMDRRHDLAEVAGHGLAFGDHEDGAVFDKALQLVDPIVGSDDALGFLDVAIDQGGDGVGNALLGKPAHLGNFLGEAVQFVVEGSDDVFRHPR